MAILALPLAISILKPRASHLSFFCAGNPSPSWFCLSPLCRRQFHRTSVCAITTSAIQEPPSTEPNNERQKASVPTFQQAIQRLQEYWASVGCSVMQCSNTEVGAGTMNPLTFLRVLGPEPWNVAYVEPSIRPDDSRYGENPNRLQRHTQFQVILKPDPGNSQDLFIRSLSALGIDVTEHDIRFVEDNWESPVLGAWGLGWEIWMDGMEITQFTYFQQAGSLQLSPVSVEITYGLERILMLLQCRCNTIMHLYFRKEMSAYYLEHANVHHLQKQFDFFEEESRSLLASGLAIPAYDQLLKTSHAFNILDSRGFVGVTERARYFGRMRSLARQCAQLWLKTRKSLGHPLGIVSEPVDLPCPKELLEAAVKKLPDDPRLFVLEIGTEEMPPQDVVNASQQVFVESLCQKQSENEFEARGPPVSKAFDQQGNPTKAVEGFCQRYAVPIDSLVTKAAGKTEYVYARVKETARLALEVMFSRPIRWIMALHGDVVVPFMFAGVLSGNLSYGLRNTPLATVKVQNAESYAGVMRNAGVKIKIEDRRKTIFDHSNALAKSVNGRIIFEESLLNEVVNLVEAPVPVLGEFEDSFLELPEDLLTVVMKKHQKYFALTDDKGRLLPYFIAVANGAINEMVVRKGNEAVLRARYEDAKFFYEMDTRKKFADFQGQLKGILFHEKLGTMLDKTMRVQNMVRKLSLDLGINEDMLQIVQEAASLAMSDLATSVVMEFTSLAGVMARHYALRDGYSQQIAEALLEINLPRFSGDVLPKTDVGTVLAVADRLDALVGLFAAGCQPSSTNDPFGLRRISYGLVQILIEKDKNLDLELALRLAADVQPITVDASTINDVDKGISPEIVRSVLSERANLPCLATKTAYKMEALSKGQLFPKVVEAYSRPTRIVRGKDVDTAPEVDETAFETIEEKALWTVYLSAKNKIHPGINVDDFIEISSELVQPLEDFFNHVFVMVEEERIRKNRLALLKKIADLPKGIVDLSLLPGF
ncbi:glycine--tRNA ligase 2 [Citrus sinensis]|uniref:Glycine--tRNA ligase 2 n=1 Tax=Citrus sinensis TaxID=2711 RepID=A0ACB8MSV2_CITSI|nr:glycine--tRNA ligase 2 [Citrus sinensis]